MAFYLLEKNDDETYNGWWEMSFDGELTDGKEVRLTNRFGGGHDHVYHEGDEIAEASSFRDLDWSKALLKPDSQYGYVDPEGSFYGCDYGDHMELADLVLGQPFPEEHGWVKIYRYYDGSVMCYTKRTFLTDAQLKTLRERGIDQYE